MKKWRTIDKILLLIAILLFPALCFFGEFTMIWNETTCAKILYLDKIKGSTYVVYEYSVDQEVKINRKSIVYFKFKELKKLKEKECFWISYSTIYPSNTRIIDKDIGNE